jgi:hypothetical protein
MFPADCSIKAEDHHTPVEVQIRADKVLLVELF